MISVAKRVDGKMDKLMIHNPLLTKPAHKLDFSPLDPPLAIILDQLINILTMRRHDLSLPFSLAEMHSREICHGRALFAIGVEIEVLRRECVLGCYWQ